ncbi:hypothetical protein BPOR_0166g00160 [Botrytis porri]|uniref:Uncharacterized protein n=1 Tax=Botrytis porri TaxID=87229 RepID=A0A4Z1KV19_9HELO|nr:hypothetical protein BPOR_0166g00160 [Botrytis porri]
MAELGEDMAANAKMHLGLDGHVTDPNKSTLAATKQDALSEFYIQPVLTMAQVQVLPFEDSAVLAEMLATPAARTHKELRAAFQAYDLCRRPRIQRPVASSRRT